MTIIDLLTCYHQARVQGGGARGVEIELKSPKKKKVIRANFKLFSLYSGESRASSRANYVITHEKLCWSISFQNVYHNKRKVIKKI